MAQNMMNSSHKASNSVYRDGWDRIFAQKKTEYAKLMITNLDILKQLRDGQCQDGKWNANPYMTGLANGLILAVSIMEDSEPHYKDIPNFDHHFVIDNRGTA